MLTSPCAKLNLGLRILRKRSDGYHEIQTLFYPIPLYDLLEVLPHDGEIAWDDGGWSGSPSEENLVYRAYRLLQQEYPTLPSVRIILRKRIPTGAGLGGGSSDAAFMLRSLQRLFGLPISEERLKQLATTLGADVPFFLTPQPSIGEGIGEILTPYPHLPDLSGWHLTLLLPGIHISTALAYAGVAPSDQGEDLREVLRRPIEEWREWLHNDFEASVFAKYPLLSELKERLYHSGATYAAMSGSGSTLFALSPEPLPLQDLDCEYKTLIL
ncbi:MAG: 4-(cytidine 5'-diphospho)-2-C-methyl-D-erythritol kinase [Porphyromonas sp.]|nr:4-(cytidine 5'-diphospho)-2-C-methyl-D-erythritol kinase [Porphyromonas sp.]